jgi:hypothetical protein
VDQISYEEAHFTRANLSDVRMIMTIMHVLVEELLCQTMMGQIPVFECLLSGVPSKLTNSLSQAMSCSYISPMADVAIALRGGEDLHPPTSNDQHHNKKQAQAV